MGQPYKNARCHLGQLRLMVVLRVVCLWSHYVSCNCCLTFYEINQRILVSSQKQVPFIFDLFFGGFSVIIALNVVLFPDEWRISRFISGKKCGKTNYLDLVGSSPEILVFVVCVGRWTFLASPFTHLVLSEDFSDNIAKSGAFKIKKSSSLLLD